MGKMTGREDKKENDLCFTCSLIDYIARKTKNRRADVVDAPGRTSVEKIYELADVYHSDHIDTVSDPFIEKAACQPGVYPGQQTAPSVPENQAAVPG